MGPPAGHAVVQAPAWGRALSSACSCSAFSGGLHATWTRAASQALLVRRVFLSGAQQSGCWCPGFKQHCRPPAPCPCSAVLHVVCAGERRLPWPAVGFFGFCLTKVDKHAALDALLAALVWRRSLHPTGWRLLRLPGPAMPCLEFSSNPGGRASGQHHAWQHTLWVQIMLERPLFVRERSDGLYSVAAFLGERRPAPCWPFPQTACCPSLLSQLACLPCLPHASSSQAPIPLAWMQA